MKNREIEVRIIILLMILLSGNILSQERMSGRLLKTGIWKGQAVEYVGGQIAVRLKEGVEAAVITKTVLNYNGVLSKNFDELRWGWISMADTVDIMPIISALQNNPAVETVEPNFIMQTHSLPNDPFFNGTSPATYACQWALKTLHKFHPEELRGQILMPRMHGISPMETLT